MKRLHVHVTVEDLAQSVRFYSTLFAAEPSVLKPDYAKWMLDDPRVNFAISARGAKPGIEHLGIQAEDGAELAEIYGRLARAGRSVLDEGVTTCCYARSEKQWISDPQGVAWETFLTHGESTVYGVEGAVAKLEATTAKACCEEPAAPAPDAKAQACGCAAE
jgi:catechol 2,3-dioxygenase-like lactoylglutathione lyase family enzyme